MLQAKQIEEQYRELFRVKAVKENYNVLVHLKWQKAANDLSLAQGLLTLSTNLKIKSDLGYTKETTFFDWVIVCSYYSIFHAAQALLGTKGIKIVDRMHTATVISFAKHFIINQELAEELFLIYEDAEAKSKELLEIFEEEKDKRGIFQYHRLSQNNLQPAEESLKNARTFLKAIQEVLQRKGLI
ncbi:MAG: HEPN domain-containing protein [Nanoarchaeota archaeon]